MLLAQWGTSVRLAVLFIVLAMTACVEPRDSFRCSDSSQCGTGRCESSGFCSFDDPACPSGHRYGEYAAEDLANTCWVNPLGDFDIAAISTSNTSVEVTFTGAPDPAAAVVLANYAINGLVIKGTPTLTGSTVTITTDPQTAQTYTITAANIARAEDGAPLYTASADFQGRPSFDVTSAVSATNSIVNVIFQAPVDPVTGSSPSNYSIPGLTITGTPVVVGNTVTLTTSPQTAISYTVTVTNVVRSNDDEPLTINSAMFTGRTSFNVTGVVSLNSTQIRVTFDAVPDAAEAQSLARYSVPGLTLSGSPTLSGSQVTITTSAQANQPYTLTVNGVTRDSDSEPLLVTMGGFQGISTFNVASAVSLSNTSIRVTFDQAPNMTQATTLANYSVSGLTLSNPVLSGNAVTFTTTPQLAQMYTVMVTGGPTGVTRNSDAEILTATTAMFPGRSSFNVASATATATNKVNIVFDAAPSSGPATNTANYSIPGLTVTAALLSGSTVTLTTTPNQSAITYTVTVAAAVTRNSDLEALTDNVDTFSGRLPFNVSSASPTNNTHVIITFSQQPNAAQAAVASNYSINGNLMVTAASVISANQVQLTTSAQLGQGYTVTVSNILRNSDSEALTGTTATFTGISQFNVMSAASTATKTFTVTFNGTPNTGQAQTPGNYSVSGLTIVSAVLAGNTVTITTSNNQLAQMYTVIVSGVTRTDGEPLTTTSAMFMGRAAFNVTSATATSSTKVVVNFDATPNMTQAQIAANYTIIGVTVQSAVLSGMQVTLTTTAQATQAYTVSVAGVTRNSDAEALTNASAGFTGRAPFNVVSVVATNNTHIVVNFDGPPATTPAQTLANYTITAGSLVLSAPTITGPNQVTLTTAPQNQTSYTLTVTGGAAGVVRTGDLEQLTNNVFSFTGIPVFNVVSAASISSTRFSVTFSNPPDPTKALTAANYTLSGGVAVTSVQGLSGNTVTLNTAAQTNILYTVTVANTVTGVTRAIDGEPLTTNTTTFTGRAPFTVASASSSGNTKVLVTYSDPPTSSQATNISNYAISGGAGLTVLAASLSGSVVTLTTSPQTAITYTVMVTGVVRMTDMEPLSTSSRTFLGRDPFNFTSATSVSNTRVTFTYSQQPNAAASTAANYTVTGGALTLTFFSASGNSVTFNTSSQSGINYTITANAMIQRLSDNEALTTASQSFAGRAQFNVSSASSTTNTQMTVTFSHPPNSGPATTLGNYSISPNIGLSGTPSLSGNTVTITTGAQTANTTYTVTVLPAVTRNPDNELLFTTMATFLGKAGFNVSSAQSVNSFTVNVTFDFPPNEAQAETASNYNFSGGLTVTGTPVLNGSTVTIPTSKQSTNNYTVTVTNGALGVTRASDGNSLSSNTANFSHVSFNVASAASVTSHSVTVTFDAAPDPTTAVNPANYTFSNMLDPSGQTITLAGNTVTIPTTAQSATMYTVTVNPAVIRASDGAVLSNTMTTFMGRAEFNVVSADSESSGSMSVTFTHPPNSTSAVVIANYMISPNTITLSNPVLSGNKVSFTTTAQAGINYTVTVLNVTRQSDAEPLTVNNDVMPGTALTLPTVTNVQIVATNPVDPVTGLTKWWNTGTVTVNITGTEFTGVVCSTGVKLDDTDGNNMPVNTGVAVSPACTVNSGTSITATFPAGVRSNGATGWNVKVTNAIGTSSSTIKLVPYAGLLLSEVMPGKSSGGGGDQEYIELFNPTGNSINVATLAIGGTTGLRLHIRNASGNDYMVTPSYIRSIIPAGGYLLLQSSGTANNAAWDNYKDGTYTTTSTDNLQASTGGVYISWGNSTGSHASVIDKLGWGGVGTPWIEPTGFGTLSLDNSTRRKPDTGTSGTDTDVNSADWTNQSTSLGFKNSLGQP